MEIKQCVYKQKYTTRLQMRYWSPNTNPNDYVTNVLANLAIQLRNATSICHVTMG